jgi:hypothetical protein
VIFSGNKLRSGKPQPRISRINAKSVEVDLRFGVFEDTDLPKSAFTSIKEMVIRYRDSYVYSDPSLRFGTVDKLGTAANV